MIERSYGYGGLLRHKDEQHGEGKAECQGCGKKIRPKTGHRGSNGQACNGEPRDSDVAVTSPQQSGAIEMSDVEDNENTCDGKCFQKAAEASKWELSEQARLHAKRRQRSMKSIRTARSVPCGLCPERISSDNLREVCQHLAMHFDGFGNENWCSECEISFAYLADLNCHNSSAAAGDCGFAFKHTVPCEGHHSPSNWTADRDRFNFSYRVRSWECAQMQLHISSTKRLADLQMDERAVLSCPAWSTGPHN